MGQNDNTSTVGKKKSTSTIGSICSIFMHADAVDIWLMILGFFGAVGDGFSTPLVLLITSHLMNNIGGASSSLRETFLTNINKVALPSHLFCQTDCVLHIPKT